MACLLHDLTVKIASSTYRTTKAELLDDQAGTMLHSPLASMPHELLATLGNPKQACFHFICLMDLLTVQKIGRASSIVMRHELG